MLCILSLQDWLSINEEARYPDADAERSMFPPIHVTIGDTGCTSRSKIDAMYRLQRSYPRYDREIGENGLKTNFTVSGLSPKL